MTQEPKPIAKSNITLSKRLPVLNLYIVVIAFLQVIGEAFSIYYLHLLKPIPIILMIIYLHKQNEKRNSIGTLVEIGLSLSLIGDILLMDQKNRSSFQLGTISFMCAHLFYIIAFNSGQRMRELSTKYQLVRKLLYTFILSLAALNIFLLYDKFTSKVIFPLYAIILALEACVGLKRYEVSTSESFKWVLIGVICFSVSDNILGMMVFDGINFLFIKAVVMVTYYAAQFCYVHGILHQINFEHLVSKNIKK